MRITRALSVVVVPASVASGQCLNEIAIEPPVIEDHLRFGRTIDVDGDVLVIGSEPLSESWRVDVYRKADSSWQHEATLMADGNINNNDVPLAVGCDFIVVGSPHAGDDRAGRVSVFRFDGQSWDLDALLDSGLGDTDAHFGEAVAVSDDVIAVSATRFALIERVYLYRRIDGSWIEAQVLSNTSNDLDACFGCDLALDGDLLAISARDEKLRLNVGAVYVYRDIGIAWVEEARLTNPHGNRPFAGYGYFVDVDEERVILSQADGPSMDLYLFDGQNWLLSENLDETMPVDGGRFPNLDGDWLTFGGTTRLVHYIARRGGSGWRIVGERTLDGFGGYEAAFDGDTLALGLCCIDPDAFGAASVIDVAACECAADCDGDRRLTVFDFLCFQGLVTTNDPSADCNADGVIDTLDFLCFQGLATRGCE